MFVCSYNYFSHFHTFISLQNSIVTDQIQYDLLSEICEITEGRKPAPEFLGSTIIPPLNLRMRRDSRITRDMSSVIDENGIRQPTQIDEDVDDSVTLR